jgi:alpha-ribazole phosphatase
MELIFLRHGETQSNCGKTYCGWTDPELNAQGIEQAQKAAEKLSVLDIDKIYSSPLKRAVETAAAVNSRLGLKIICRDELKERNFGVWDDLTYEQICNSYPKEVRLWESDWLNYRIQNGESALDMFHRVTGFVDELIEQGENRVLLVTHLGCIRIAISHLLGMGTEGMWRFRADNGSISRISINNQGYAYLTALNV